ncbi:TPA: hydroxyacylglutathione hydrolase, partial [Enterobacter asburiae]|nr:hydroxyacylglutathione hydrolase [Enterobacter asburiae]
MNLISIPAFQDNYIWVLVDDDRRCVIVDPGESAPVLHAIKENGWKPEAVLLTHHHNDHTGGVPELRAHFPHLVVYGPAEAQDKGITHVVEEGENILIREWEFSVFATPGHTLGHLCFYSKPYLFCGDTLFSGGCGRLFEGTPAQMYQSLQKINALPDETLVCCAHEYTLGNMKFAVSLLPEDR